MSAAMNRYACEKLVACIYQKAASDLLSAYRRILRYKETNYKHITAANEIVKLENFFQEDPYHILSENTANIIIKQCKEDARTGKDRYTITKKVRGI